MHLISSPDQQRKRDKQRKMDDNKIKHAPTFNSTTILKYLLLLSYGLSKFVSGRQNPCLTKQKLIEVQNIVAVMLELLPAPTTFDVSFILGSGMSGKSRIISLFWLFRSNTNKNQFIIHQDKCTLYQMKWYTPTKTYIISIEHIFSARPFTNGQATLICTASSPAHYWES